ncbi:hypothetical protein N8D56_21425 [Devosia sp. A8/3-2]|nr:hypothetical protein N8D56_21425 [Devosia sp. A8/3-2]
MTLSTYPISNGLPAFNLGHSFLEYAIQREMKMASIKENLIAAQALIDTPEKFDEAGIITPLLSGGVSIAMFNQMRGALLSVTDGSTDRIAIWVRDKPHAEIMAMFNRAIDAQDEVA